MTPADLENGDSLLVETTNGGTRATYTLRGRHGDGRMQFECPGGVIVDYAYDLIYHWLRDTNLRFTLCERGYL